MSEDLVSDSCSLAPPATHHRRPAPEDHLCACGQLRADCVRRAVRAVWSDPTAAASRWPAAHVEPATPTRWAAHRTATG